MYQRYLSDPASVDPAWHEFFADYQPTPERAAGTVETSVPTTGRPAPSGAGRRAVPPPAAARPAQPPPPKPAQAKPAQAKPAPAPPAQPPTPQPVDADSAAQPGTRSTAPAPARPAGRPQEGSRAAVEDGGPVPLRGIAARIAENMDQSLSVPTATSVRAVPAKLLEDNRIVTTTGLARGRGGKASFTHLIGYAVVRAIAAPPAMTRAYTQLDGRPAMVDPEHVNLGLAIDLPRPDGSRTLVVANIQAAATMDFRHFWQAYEDLVRRARRSDLTEDDHAGTTVEPTHHGGHDTAHSLPRLMAGQGTIVGVGAIEYPAPYQGMADE